MDVFICAGAAVAHAAGDGAVFQRDGVLPLNDQSFGVVGGQVGVFYGDGCGGVDGGGILAVGGVAAAVHIDGSAAAVGADGRRRVAGGLDRQVGGVGGVAVDGVGAGALRHGAGAAKTASRPALTAGPAGFSLVPENGKEMAKT